MTSDSWQETEIGEFPSSWDIGELGSIYNIQQGKALSGRKQKPGDESYPFLRTSNVYWGRTELATLDTMPFSAVEREKLRLQPNDLLICEGGDIGRTALWRGELADCFYQNHLFRVRAKTSNVESAFHMYWMQAALTQLGLYGGAGNKTTIPNLSRSRLSSFLIPLPPLPEQRRIAAVLNAIQEAIAAQEDVIAAARHFKRSLMQRLFTYGPGREPAETKATEIGEIPAHWEVVKLGDVATLQRGYDLPKQNRKAGIVPIVTSSGISGTHDEAKVRGPGVVTGRYGTLGDVYFIESDFWPHNTTLFVNDFHGNYPKFVARLLERTRLGVLNDKTSVPGINRNHAHQLPIGLPPVAEQKLIDEMLNTTDAKIAAEEDRKTALEALFKSMLHQLMTGQIRLLTDEGLLLLKN